jgi:hemoglobin
MGTASTLRIIVISLLSALAIMTTSFAADGEAEAPSLYERLGAADGLEKIVRDTIALHHENPDIAHYFAEVDDDVLAAHVAAFFAAGTGGPVNYQGRDMTVVHASMNMSDADFDSAVADVLKAVKANGVDAASAAEVAAILESLRPAVMGTAQQGKDPHDRSAAK